MRDAKDILEYISTLKLDGFFVTAEVCKQGGEHPQTLCNYIIDKHQAIMRGTTVRKFVFHNEGWRIILTFFPTTEVVDERYALKNKIFRRR